MRRYLFFLALLLPGSLPAFAVDDPPEKTAASLLSYEYLLRSKEDVDVIAQRMRTLLIEALQAQKSASTTPTPGYMVLTPLPGQPGLKQASCEPSEGDPKIESTCIRLNEQGDFVDLFCLYQGDTRVFTSQLHVVAPGAAVHRDVSHRVVVDLTVTHRMEAFSAVQEALAEVYRRLGAQSYEPH